MLEYSNSQINQDLFVLCVLNGLRNGTYVEVGANQPIIDSNTFLLESKFDWIGVSFELSEPLVDEFNRVRKNVCIRTDATNVDYSNIFRLAKFSNNIDYLQLDIEPPQNTLKALKSIDLKRFTFSVITFEHDFYNGGASERLESRRILEEAGYTRVVSDAKFDGISFEDWWIKEDRMPSNNWKHFIGENISMNTRSMPEETRNFMESIIRGLGSTYL